VSQYFPPEMGAPAARVYELSRRWGKAGHKVTVLTGFPNHPTGSIPEAYRKLFRRGTVTEELDGMRVVRTWLYPTPNRFPLERIVNYTSFFVSASLRGMVLSRPDVVIATSPQLLVGLAGWWLARRFRRPFVFEVRDLWPESLPASGIGRPGSVLYRVLDSLANFLYRSADKIVVLTDAFREHLVLRKRADHGKVAVIENGVEPELFRPMDGTKVIRDSLGLAGRFVISYIGTLGFAHNLQTALRAAAILRDRLPEALFVFVGDGAETERLKKEVRLAGLENIKFFGQQPRELIPQFIGASDVCLVLLRKDGLFETVLPSKMLEFMACGRPVLIGVDGLARKIVEESNSGLFVKPEDPLDLAEAVLRLHRDPEARHRYGENGRRWVEARFTREAKAREYLEVLEGLISR